MKKIYLAGKITGDLNYKEKFRRAEEELIRKRFIVLNPAFLPKGLEECEYMRICLPMLSVCDAIYLLEGWEESEGAVIEYLLAMKTGKEVIYGRKIRNEDKKHSSSTQKRFWGGIRTGR